MTDTTAATAPSTPGGFTAHAWHRLATDPHAGRLSAIRKLTFLAAARHADQADGGERGSAVADLSARTALPRTALITALTALVAAGWLDGDDSGGYRPTGTTSPGVGDGSLDAPGAPAPPGVRRTATGAVDAYRAG